MIITQDMINVCLQDFRTIYCKIEILNSDYAVINSIEGIVLDGTTNQSIINNYRRNGSLTLVVVDNVPLAPVKGSNIWFNNIIRIWIGIENFLTNKIVYMNQGIFCIKDYTNLIDVKQGQQVTLDLVDLTATLDGTLNGQLINTVQLIAQSTDINTAVLTTIRDLGKISKYNINGSTELIPYNVIQQPNTSIYNLISVLVNLFLNYEFFFDEDGYFVYQKIPDLQADPIAFDMTGINITVQYQQKLDFSNIKNAVYCWGKQQSDGTQPYWVYRNTFSTITDTEMNAITGQVQGDICYVSNDNKSYMWDTTSSTWTVLDFNVVPDFNITNIGVHNWVINDNNCYNVSQAKLQCEYNLWLKSNFGETVTFSCVPLYFLLVNTKIRLNVPDYNIVGDYRITNIQTSLKVDQPMQIQCAKVYASDTT